MSVSKTIVSVLALASVTFGLGASAFGQLIWFADQGAFEAAVGSGHTLIGIEDYEASVLLPSQVDGFDDALVFGVPNLPDFFPFPNGTQGLADLITQSNRLGEFGFIPSPQGIDGLVAGSNGFQGLTSDAVLSNTLPNALDLIFISSVHAVGGRVIDVLGPQTGVEIMVFSDQNNLLGQMHVPGDAGGFSFTGVISTTAPIGRINMFSAGAEGMDDIQAYFRLPGPGACCLPNGTCVDGETAFSCNSLGGAFQGGGSQCAPLLCGTQSITTLFASDNFGAEGGGVYFDVTVGADPIEIISFEVNSTAVVGTTLAFEAYTHVGGASTFENSPAGWTLVATGSGSAAGQGIPTPVTLNAPFVLPANTTLGMALTLGPVAGHAYTDGNGANQHYADANVALDLGQANNAIFGPGLFSPRVWNGTITYNVVLPPIILTQPASIGTRCTGASATFQVVAGGAPTLSYQWRQDGLAIPGATGASFTIASVMLADAGSYDVVVTNNVGTVTSNAATLSVCPGPGDMNGDGLVNAADTALFVTALLAG